MRMFGSSLADVFSSPAYDCRVVGSDQKPEFAVTRLRSGPREMEKAPVYPPDEAILICVSLTPAALGQWKASYNGKSVGVTRAIPFATTFIDLRCRMEMWARGPFDYLHYYLSRELLKRIAVDNAVSPSFQLREAFFIEDLVVAQMTKNILSSVKHGEPLDRLELNQTATVVGAHILQTRCGVPKFGTPGQARIGAVAKTPKRGVVACASGGKYHDRRTSRCLLTFGESFRAMLSPKLWHVRTSAVDSASDRTRQGPALWNR